MITSSLCQQIVRHGGALGLGLAALGTARQDVYDLLKANLYQDDAVTGVKLRLHVFHLFLCYMLCFLAKYPIMLHLICSTAACFCLSSFKIKHLFKAL